MPTPPGPTRERILRLAGLDFFVRVTGAGSPRDLLHGLLDSGELWRHQIASLAALCRTVVVADLRGFGATDAPPETGAYRLGRLARDVLEIVEAVSPDADRFDLAGHDWGPPSAGISRPATPRASAGSQHFASASPRPIAGPAWSSS